MSPIRPSGKLPLDVLDVLTQNAQPMTAKAVHEQVTAISKTSEGAVRHVLRDLCDEGKVQMLPTSPQEFALTGNTAVTVPVTPAPSTASMPVPAMSRVAPVQRPGGSLYHPRELNGKPDVDVLRKLRDVGAPVLLQGPPGTGKTALAEAAHPDLVTIAGDGDTCVSDFVGEYTQEPGGNFVFVYGPLVVAMREGRALFIDDATLIPPPVLATLYPAMDGRGEIAIKAHKAEVVKAAPGFYVLAGHNPGVHGAVLTEALASRFSVHVEVETDYDLAKQLGVPAAAVRIAKALNKKRGEGKLSRAPQMRELIAFRDTEAAMGRDFALMNLLSTTPEDDRALVAQVINKEAGGGQRSPLRLGAQIKTVRVPQPSPAAPSAAPSAAPTASSQPNAQTQPQGGPTT